MKNASHIDVSSRDDAETLLRRFRPGSGRALLKPCKPPADFRPDGWMPFTEDGAKAYAELVECLYAAGALAGMEAEAEKIVEEMDESFCSLVPTAEGMESDPFDEIDEAEDARRVDEVVRDAFASLPAENAVQVLEYSRSFRVAPGEAGARRPA